METFKLLRKIAIFLLCLLPLQTFAAESKLAQKANAALINTWFVIAGENGDDGGTIWDATKAEFPGGSCQGGGSANEKWEADYEADITHGLRIIWSGTGHAQGAGCAHNLYEYNITNNTITNKGSTDPTGLFDAHGADKDSVGFTVTGNAASGYASYIALTPDSCSGTCSGSGITVNITRNGGTYVYVSQNGNSTPTSYHTGDVYTFLGSHLGGINGGPGTGNNLAITITSDTPLAYNNNGHGYGLSGMGQQLRHFCRVVTSSNINACVNIDKDFGSISSADWALNELAYIPAGAGFDRGSLVWNHWRNAWWYFQSSTGKIFELGPAEGAAWVQVADLFNAPSLYGDGTFFVINPARHSIMFGAGEDVADSSIKTNHLWEATFNAADTSTGSGCTVITTTCTTGGITFRKLDDLPSDTYVAQGDALPFVDPVSGHFFIAIAVISPQTRYQLQGIWECDPALASTHQFSERTDLEASMPRMGNVTGDNGNSTPSYLSNVIVANAYDQGTLVFIGEHNIYGLKLTANTRAGHETGNGTLTMADYLTFPNVSDMLHENFSNPSAIRAAWDGSDAALTADMNAAGWTTNHTFTYVSGSAQALGIAQPQIHSSTVPSIVNRSGQNWLNLPIPTHVGESGAKYFDSINGSYPASGQRFYISPNSPWGRTWWLSYDFLPDPAFFSSLWRKTGLNYQDGGLATIGTGSNVIYMPGIGAGNIHNTFNNVNIGGTYVSAPNWANGRDVAIWETGSSSDDGIWTVTGTVDNSHVTVNHTFSSSTASAFAVFSGAGDGALEGFGSDLSIDGFKQFVTYSSLPTFSSIGGDLVFINARAPGVYTALTKSPNVYSYTVSGGLAGQPTTNDGNVPYPTSGIIHILVRFQMYPTANILGGGLTTNRRVTWWVNGVGGETPYTDWTTSPAYYGSSDDQGQAFGMSILMFTMQRTFADVTQANIAQQYLITNIVSSTSPLFPDSMIQSLNNGYAGRIRAIKP